MFDSSGEITPPCGVPATVADPLPVFHHPCLEPLPQQLEHPAIRDAPRHELHQLLVVDAAEVIADVGVEHVIPAARAAARAAPPAPASRSASAESRTRTARKSASKIGSSTSFAAICATRSRTVGMPSGRFLPSAFGMYRRRTGCGRYLPARSSAPSSSKKRSTPYCSMSRASAHRRPPRHGSASPASTLPAGRHSCRSGHTAHGSGAPGIAWPRPTAGVGVVALCRRASARRGDWDRSCRPCPRAYLLRRRDHRRDPSLPSRCSSRGSSRYYDPLGLPLRTRSTSPSAYTSRLAPTRAAQTGLSCSAPLLAHVLRPIPRRDLRACFSGLPHRRRGLRRDMTGSALGLFICRGCRLHFMLRPARLLPP